ncbi:MAG: sensor histidine kinase [Candidatus Latescibacterota bacterium]
MRFPKFWQLPTISQAFLLFLFMTVIGMGVLSAYSVFFLVNKEVTNIVRDHLEHDLENIVRHWYKMQDIYLIILEDQAKIPILVQAVMMPETNRNRAIDILETVTFLRKKHRMILLDYEGEIICESRSSPAFTYRDRSFISTLINKDRHGVVELDIFQGEYYWRLVEPIEYQGQVEGFLVLEAHVNEIDFLLNSNLEGNDTRFEFSVNNNVIKTYGYITENYQMAQKEIKDQIFRVKASDLPIKVLKKKMLNIVWQGGLIFALGVIVLGFYLGDKFIVKPLQFLLEQVKKFARSSFLEFALPRYTFREVFMLHVGFKHMAKKVRDRETELNIMASDLRVVNDALKQAQVSLVQSERLAVVGQLSAGVAHEINNPIGFVKSNLGMLEEYFGTLKKQVEDYKILQSHPEDDDRRRALTRVLDDRYDNEVVFVVEDSTALFEETNKGISRVQKIVESLRSYSRIDSKGMEYVCLNDCVEETLSVFWPSLNSQVKIKKELSKVPRVACYVAEINQIIACLLSNAEQAISGDGEVWVKTYVQGDECVLTVNDNGCGIPETYLDRIFDPFYTSKDVGQGAGLGLSIAKKIIGGCRINISYFFALQRTFIIFY